MFAGFNAALKDKGYHAMGGQIIDAGVVQAPKQRSIGRRCTSLREAKKMSAHHSRSRFENG